MDSLRERLTSVVMGFRRAGRQDLRRVVGMSSRVQVESEEVRINVRISSGVAGSKCCREGGVKEGWI